MGFIQKRKRRFGDRRDGVWVKDAPGINIIMSMLYPNRCDCEVSMHQELDITELLKYIEQKNTTIEGGKLKLFHCIVTMMVRILNTRTRLNRFVQGGRMYERDYISVCFVAKRMFNDEAEEVLLTYKAKANHTVEDVKRFVLGEVAEVRGKSQKNTDVNKTINTFAKLPRFILLPIVGFVRWLDKWGKVPKALTAGDPAFSSVLVTNLGSIKCPAVYHHLNNYGTNSIMLAIGTMRKKNVIKEDGSVEVRDVVDIQVTADERIADGFYFAKSIKLLNYICANPSILDIPYEQDVDFEEI